MASRVAFMCFAKQPKAVKAIAHRLAGTSLNVGLSKIAQEFRTIEGRPEKPIANPEALDKMLELSLYWLKYHLSQILHDLAS